VGEINLEEDPRTPTEPVLSIPSEEILTSAEPRRKRVKTLAGRMDLPWVRKLLAQQSKGTPTSHQLASQTLNQPASLTGSLLKDLQGGVALQNKGLW